MYFSDICCSFHLLVLSFCKGICSSADCLALMRAMRSRYTSSRERVRSIVTGVLFIIVCSIVSDYFFCDKVEVFFDIGGKFVVYDILEVFSKEAGNELTNWRW